MIQYLVEPNLVMTLSMFHIIMEEIWAAHGAKELLQFILQAFVYAQLLSV